jgi:hypothetical protein
MTPQDRLILFRVAFWIGDGHRKVVKTIRQIAETEENYRIVIAEIDRVEAQIRRARTLRADATLTLLEWLVTLEDFGWLCAYCQCKPFKVMSHVIPLPTEGTTPENCVPACYSCRNRYRNNEQMLVRIQTYLANRKNWDEHTLILNSTLLPSPLS